MSDMLKDSPLDESHLLQINNSLDALNSARNQIKLAQRAGIDVTKQQAALDDTERQLKQIKQVYFPNR